MYIYLLFTALRLSRLSSDESSQINSEIQIEKNTATQ